MLNSIRLEGAVYFNAEFTEPWCVWSKFGLPYVSDRLPRAEYVLCFHFITKGHCQIRLSNQDEVIYAGAGDFIIFPQDDRHLVGSDLRLIPVEPADLMAINEDGVLELHHGGGGNATRLICGYIDLRKSAHQPLLDALPGVLRVSVGDTSWTDLISNLLRKAVKESSTRSPGSESLLAKLSEFMFVEALRGYVRQLPDEATGWLGALRDRQIGDALAILHSDPSRSWTVGELAREVALSRSAFAQRFALLTGIPPIKYLKRWCLARAAKDLLEGTDAIARIATNSGYHSEAAFNKAFRRQFGLPPGAWRKAANSPKNFKPRDLPPPLVPNGVRESCPEERTMEGKRTEEQIIAVTCPILFGGGRV